MALSPVEMSLPRLTSALRTIARVAGVIPVVTGVLVLMGWWLGIELLKRIMPGLVAMNPATAVGFICLGLALALAISERRRRAGNALALVAALLGAIKVLALISPLDVPVDQLLFTDQLEMADRGQPNRMAPNTALNFLLLGTALLIIDREVRRIWPAQFLTVIAAMASLLALLGYAYGVKSFYGIGAYIPMALNTAATFFVVSVGILAARPTRGIMAVFSSNSSGGTMVRRLLPAVLILPALLGWFRLAGTRAHLFDQDFGLWLLVVMIMSIFAVLIGWNGRLLFRSDVEKLMAARSLSHQATHDALTQLPNRRLFIEQLEQELERGKQTAVLFVDLDLFKIINDSLGHVIGDELLISAGKRITDALQGTGLVARLSGDEFTVMLRESDDARAADLAGRIVREFSVPFTLGLHEVFTTASVGIALSEPGDTPLNLIRHADMAMFQAKKSGKARY